MYIYISESKTISIGKLSERITLQGLNSSGFKSNKS